MILHALWHVFISFQQTALFPPPLVFLCGLFAFLLISRQSPSKTRGPKGNEARGNGGVER